MNIGEAVGILMLSGLQAISYGFSHINFWLMAAIFDFPYPLRSCGIRVGAIVQLDPENMGIIAVEISLLSCFQANYSRLLAAIFNLPLTLTSDSIRTGPVVLPDPENMGKAVGDSLLSLCTS